MAAEGRPPHSSEGSSAENNLDLVDDKDHGEDEEFYENIEAPKFVDFTLPSHYSPDDRYWFCLRVGCDQKHEVEMDSEAIYKNFVLRVMAARSPNVRLHKALNRNASGKKAKCPLSAPPKPSKSRLPRLAMVSSLSERMGEETEKAKPQPKVGSTPVAKGKQVPSKYLTTPSYKKCPPNPRSFQSVRKPKPPTLVEPKTRTVAKALTFQTPRKVLNLKKSIELHTPVTKLCEGLKNLEITNQRKHVLGYSSKTSKPIGNNSRKSPPTSSTRQKVYNLEKPRSKMLVQACTQNNKDTKSSRSVKYDNKDKASNKESVPNDSYVAEINSRSRPSNDENHAGSEYCRERSTEAAEDAAHAITEVPPTIQNIDSISTNASEAVRNDSSNSSQINLGGDDSPGLPASNKENEGIEEMGCTGCESLVTQSNNKENASALDENGNLNNGEYQIGRRVLGMQNSDGRKESADKDLKGSAAVGAAGIKMMKPKSTNTKPFSLQTDERGILKETNSERRNDVATPQKEVTPVSRPKDGYLHGEHGDIHKVCRKMIAAVRTPEQHMVRKKPTSLKGHTSKLQGAKRVTSTHQSNSCRDLKNDLRKSTFSSRMHAMASKLTPIKQVCADTEIPREKKFNTNRSRKA